MCHCGCICLFMSFFVVVFFCSLSFHTLSEFNWNFPPPSTGITKQRKSTLSIIYILRIKSSACTMINNQNKVIQIQFAGLAFCYFVGFFWIIMNFLFNFFFIISNLWLLIFAAVRRVEFFLFAPFKMQMSQHMLLIWIFKILWGSSNITSCWDMKRMAWNCLLSIAWFSLRDPNVI